MIWLSLTVHTSTVKFSAAYSISHFSPFVSSADFLTRPGYHCTPTCRSECALVCDTIIPPLAMDASFHPILPVAWTALDTASDAV